MSARKGVAKKKQKEEQKKINDAKREKRNEKICNALYIGVQLAACTITNIIIGRLAMPAEGSNRASLPNEVFTCLAILVICSLIFELPLNHKMKDEVTTKDIMRDSLKGIAYYLMAAIVGIVSAAFLKPLDKNFWSNVLVYAVYIVFYFVSVFTVCGIVSAGNKVAKSSRKYKISPLLAEIIIAIIFGAAFMAIVYWILK